LSAESLIDNDINDNSIILKANKYNGAFYYSPNIIEGSKFSEKKLSNTFLPPEKIGKSYVIMMMNLNMKSTEKFWDLKPNMIAV
jgi:hypothetical protein